MGQIVLVSSDCRSEFTTWDEEVFYNEDYLTKELLTWCKDLTDKTLDTKLKDYSEGAKIGHEGIIPIIRIFLEAALTNSDINQAHIDPSF
jgi:hypothetical protein